MNWQIIIIVTLIVLIVALLAYLGSDMYKRKLARQEYKKSIGTFDGAAQSALKAAQEVTEARAEDKFIAADILDRNVLEGDVRRARGNIEVVGTIIDLYRGVVHDVHIGNNDGQIGAPFMLDRVDTFIFQQGPVIMGDDILANVFQELFGLTNEANEAADVTRMAKIEAAKGQAETKIGASEAFFDSMKAHENDPQNVHDTAVSDDLRETLGKIRASFSGRSKPIIFQEISQFIDEVKDMDFDQETKSRALSVLNRIIKDSNGADSVYIMSYGANEDDILAFVWDRSHLEANRSHRHKMQLALAKSLADCIEDGQEVCPPGRASRMMASLVLLDKADEGLGATVLYEDYKNEIYSRASKLIKDEIAATLASEDPDMRQVAQSYDDPSISPSPDAESAFKAQVGRKLEALVDEYAPKLRDYQVEKLKRDVVAGLI
jgi:hypothetical protein